MDAILYIVLMLVILLPLYFLPAIVAASRNNHNTAAIFVLNLFLGWTFLGWVIALIWAMMASSMVTTSIHRATLKGTRQ